MLIIYPSDSCILKYNNLFDNYTIKKLLSFTLGIIKTINVDITIWYYVSYKCLNSNLAITGKYFRWWSVYKIINFFCYILEKMYYIIVIEEIIWSDSHYDKFTISLIFNTGTNQL